MCDKKFNNATDIRSHYLYSSVELTYNILILIKNSKILDSVPSKWEIVEICEFLLQHDVNIEIEKKKKQKTHWQDLYRTMMRQSFICTQTYTRHNDYNEEENKNHCSFSMNIVVQVTITRSKTSTFVFSSYFLPCRVEKNINKRFDIVIKRGFTRKTKNYRRKKMHTLFFFFVCKKKRGSNRSRRSILIIADIVLLSQTAQKTIQQLFQIDYWSAVN